MTVLAARGATVIARLDQNRPVNGVAFSPDGRMLVAGTGDASASPTQPPAWSFGMPRQVDHDRLPARPHQRRLGGRLLTGWPSLGHHEHRPDDDRLGHRHACCGGSAIARRPHLRQPPPLRGVQPRRPTVGDRGAPRSRSGISNGVRVVGKPLDPGGGGAVLALGFGSAGDSLVASTAAGTAAVWDLGGSRRWVSSCPASGPTAVCSVVTAGSSRRGTGPVPAVGVPQTITLVDAKTHRRLGTLGKAATIAFTADGGRLAFVADDGSVQIIDTSTRRPLVRPQRQTVIASGLAFSPDGSLLAVGHFDGSTALLDSATGEPRGGLLRGHTSLVPVHRVPTRREADGDHEHCWRVDRLGPRPGQRRRRGD